MFTTVNFSDFCDAFLGDRKDTFSYEGKRALFEYLERLEEDTGTPLELDPVALCCEYTEYDSALEGAREYGYEEGVDLEPHGSVDLIEVSELENKQALEWLEERTQVIQIPVSKNLDGTQTGGGVIILQF